MRTTDNYDEILQESSADHRSVGSAWSMIAVLAVLLVSVSSLVHFL
jgi:hypothetical protein